MHERLLNPECTPSEDQISEWIGSKVNLWIDLKDYLATHYDHDSELDFGGKKYGWGIRYRKSGKTLVTLFPERGRFTVLVVLGKKEVEKTEKILDTLSAKIRRLFQETEQLHDGRWLWIQPSTKADIQSIKALLRNKRRPKVMAT